MAYNPSWTHASQQDQYQRSSLQGTAPSVLQPNMPQLPPDLQGLNLNPQQLAALISHIQAGNMPFLPPPPPPPPPPSSFPPAAPHPSLPFPPSLPPVSNGQRMYQGSGATHHIQEQVYTPAPTYDMPRDGQGPFHTISAMQIDREDGELSDGSKQTPISVAPSTSRKRKLAAPSNEPRRTSQFNGTRRPLSPEGNAFYRASHSNTTQFLQQKKSLALPLLAALHDEGFRFEEFVQEGYDEAQLRAAYDELKITIPTSSHGESMRPASNTQDAPGPAAYQQAPVQAVDKAAVAPLHTNDGNVTTAPSAANATTAAKPAPALTRQDYLARLQAAKTKKQSIDAAKQASTQAPSPKPAETVTPPVVIEAAKLLPANVVDTTPTPVTSSKQAQLTELARKKMEALKAMQRRMANKVVTPAPAATPPAVLRTDVSASPVPASANGVANARVGSADYTKTSQPAQALSDSGVDRPHQSFSGGIPGLHMPSASSQSTPNPVQPSQSLPLQLPVVATTAQQADVSTSSASENSPAPVSAPASYFPAGVANTSARKRPVAADLNELHSAPDTPRYKRPFGQSRRNSSDDAMIIEVSDDEGADAPGDSNLTNNNTTANSSAPRQLSIRDLPPLRDFPPRPTFPRANGLSTPPVGTPGTASDTEELRRKEQQIAALNLKIQEMQKKKTSLKANGQAGQSLPQTPAPASPLVSKAQTPQASVSAVLVPRLPADIPSAATPQQSTIIPVNSPADKRLKIQADITARDIDINNQKARIMEMQRQIAEMQRQFEEDTQKQEKLREELESLDIDTQGMTQSEMQAKKDEIDRNLEEVQPADGGGAMSLDSGDESGSEFEPAEAIPPFATTNGTSNVPQSVPSTGTSSEEEGEVSEPSLADEGEMDLSQSSPVEGAVEQEKEIEIVDATDQQTPENTETIESADMASQGEPARLHVGNLPFSITREELSALFSDSDTSEIHMPIKNGRTLGFAFVSLPLSQAVTAIDQLSNLVIHGRKINVQMARPRGPPAGTPVKVATPASVVTSEDSSSDDEMDTESSEDDEDGDEDEEESAEDGEIEDGETDDESDVNEANPEITASSDMSISSGSDVDEEPLQQQPDSEPTQSTQESTNTPSTISAQPFSQHQIDEAQQSTTDDLASELQPDLDQQTVVDDTHDILGTPAEPAFKPYDSVLKKFRKYRFHQDFLNTVPGGFRSMSYSNRIDPQTPLCRFEVASGVCNDPDCSYQHFRDMGLTDDMLLVELGTKAANPAKTPEDFERYNAGLRNVISQLRVEGIRDSESVAARITKYRREFIQDPSNILSL